MLQLGALKLVLYIDCFILPLLDSSLSTFCFPPPLPHYFHFSHAVCPSPDKLTKPHYTQRLIAQTTQLIFEEESRVFCCICKTEALFDLNWGILFIQRKFFKSVSRKFTSLKKNCLS